MPADEDFALVSFHMYAVRPADRPDADARALLVGCEVHGFLPEITPDDIRTALLALADSIPAQLVETWGHMRAERN